MAKISMSGTDLKAIILNSPTNDKVLDQSKLEAFADNKVNDIQKIKKNKMCL